MDAGCAGRVQPRQQSPVRSGKTKNLVFSTFCLFGGALSPILGDAVEGVMAAWSPYPQVLVPSSAFPQAAFRAKMLVAK